MALSLEDIQRRRSEVASSLSAAQTKLGVLESQISSLSSSLGYATVPSESQLRSDLAALDREIASSESLLSAAESEMSSWLSKYDALRGFSGFGPFVAVACCPVGFWLVGCCCFGFRSCCFLGSFGFWFASGLR